MPADNPQVSPTNANAAAGIVSSIFGGSGAAGIQAISDIANSPPPSSAAALQNSSPISVNPTALNLGSILQPYTAGGAANGGYGYNVTSPLGGSIGASGVGSKTVLYVAVAVVSLGGVFLLARRK